MPAQSVKAPELLVKHPDESLLHGCKFKNVLVGSDLLTGTPLVTDATSDLTLTAKALDVTNKIVNVRIAGGTHGVLYPVVFEAGDDAGNTHVIVCDLLVSDGT